MAELAEGGRSVSLSPEDWEKIKKGRRLRELFRGRFSPQESTTLLNHHEWDLDKTVTFVLDALPGQLRDVLGENDWHLVGGLRQDQVLGDLARRNQVGAYEVRQFTCGDCDKMWWRRVFTRKLVSRCKLCHRKKEALDRDKEWGLALFNCVPNCRHTFRAYGMMDISILGLGLIGKSKSLCWKCKQVLCQPKEILPPFKREDVTGLRRRLQHTCTAPNCYNRGPSIPNVPDVDVCVHPNSLEGVVHEPSVDHISTGSTVNTFLPQDDLIEPYEASLADIQEITTDHEDDDDDENN